MCTRHACLGMHSDTLCCSGFCITMIIAHWMPFSKCVLLICCTDNMMLLCDAGHSLRRSQSSSRQGWMQVLLMALSVWQASLEQPRAFRCTTSGALAPRSSAATSVSLLAPALCNCHVQKRARQTLRGCIVRSGLAFTQRLHACQPAYLRLV